MSLVLGEKLEPGRAERVPDAGIGVPDARGVLSGFFIIEAPDYETAVDIARGSPHVGHGGTVVVRAIEPT